LGLLERLTEAAKGGADLFTAPLGFVVDVLRSIPDGNFDPGQIAGRRLTQAIGGVAGISRGLGFNEVGEIIATETPVDEALGAIIREGELLYNTSYQRELGQAPVGLREFGVQPGAVSIQRAGATAGATVGGTLGFLTGQSPEDPFTAAARSWSRSAFQSPGQSVVSGLVGLHSRSPQEQEIIKGQWWYNLVSGSIDAVSRWYLQPEVLAGKGVRKFRARYNLDRLQARMVKRYGLNAEAIPDSPVGFSLGEGGTFYAVYRQSDLRNLLRTGLDIDEAKIPAGLLDQASDAVPTNRTAFLIDSKEQALKYAADLQQVSPGDPSIILEVDSKGLPVFFEDFLEDLVDGVPGSEALMADIRNLGPNVRSVLSPFSGDVTPALTAKLISNRVKPTRLYNPDGSPVPPNLLASSDEADIVFRAASDLYQTAGEDAAIKFLRFYRSSRQGPNAVSSMTEALMTRKEVQQSLNWIDGKTADQIRRRLFPKNAYGPLLSHWLSQADSYQERYWILAASMGQRIPDSIIIAPLARAKLDKLLDDMESVARGGPITSPVEASMLTGVFDEDFDVLLSLHSNELDLIHQEIQYGDFMDALAVSAPTRELPRLTATGSVRESIRQTRFYQSSPISRPVRAVIEKRPHRFLHLNDPQGDIQLVRQLEEAKTVLNISADEIAGFRARYMGAVTEAEKLQVVIAAENRIIEAAGKRAGLKPKQIEELVSKANRGKRTVGRYLQSRRYAPEREMDVVRYVDPDSGQVMEMALPILGTQLQAWLPLSDVREVIRQSTKVRQYINRHGGRVAPEIMDSFYAVWKPAVLLRGGWFVRVVADEQLRILAKTGSLVKHLAAIEAGERVRFAHFEKGMSGGQVVGSAYGLIPTVETATAQRLAAGLSKPARRLRRLDPQFYDDLVEAGTEPMASARASFGGPNEQINMEMATLFSAGEMGIWDHLKSRSTGNWTSVGRSDPMYAPSWERALNEQIRQDPFAQVLVTSLGKGLSVDDAAEVMRRWLLTAEGRAYAAKVPWRAARPDRWVDEVIGLTQYVTADFHPNIIGKLAANKRVTARVLETVDESLWPETIHGEIIDQTLNRGVVNEFINDTLTTTFHLYGSLPTDTLSRQPFFRHMYAEEMSRLRRQSRLQGLEPTVNDLKKMQVSARTYAVQQVRTYLYDLAETSRFGALARHFIPFYNAWQEILTVWLGIAAKDPSVAARALLLWNAPDRANLVTKDDEGNSYITLQLSEGTLDKLGVRASWLRYVLEGGVKVNKQSFNMVLANPAPSAGPLVQVPVNEVLKNRPEWEADLRFILPYGVQPDSVELLKSPLWRRAESALTGLQGDRSYQRAWMDVTVWLDWRYRTGQSSVPPSYEEAHEVAGKINVLRVLANLLSPAQPIFDTPLKPYIDIHRDLIEQYGSDMAEEIFLNQYGAEYLGVTLSRSVTKTGIPPTINAQVARRAYESLIEKYPEWGNLIIGNAAGIGEFSTAAYASQLSTKVGHPLDPNAPVERQYRQLDLDPDTGKVEEIDRRAGWIEYIKAMDLIEVERRSRGLPNLRVKDAEDLANLKRLITAALRQKYPAWARAFAERNELKWQQRMESLRVISSNELMEDRPDMEGIQIYLQARGLIRQELNNRKQSGGSATLQALTNQDLLIAWETIVAKILSDNIAFAPIYFRYLEGDPVSG